MLSDFDMHFGRSIRQFDDARQQFSVQNSIASCTDATQKIATSEFCTPQIDRICVFGMKLFTKEKSGFYFIQTGSSYQIPATGRHFIGFAC